MGQGKPPNPGPANPGQSGARPGGGGNPNAGGGRGNNGNPNRGGGNANNGRPDGVGRGRGNADANPPDGAQEGRGRGRGNATNQPNAEGFKNYGQMVAARHVSENLGIDFDKLKALMTGDNPKSLGEAIQELRPAADANGEAAKAEKQAETDIKNTGGSSNGS